MEVGDGRWEWRLPLEKRNLSGSSPAFSSNSHLQRTAIRGSVVQVQHGHLHDGAWSVDPGF